MRLFIALCLAITCCGCRSGHAHHPTQPGSAPNRQYARDDEVQKAVAETMAEGRRAVDEHGVSPAAMKRIEAALARLGRTSGLKENANLSIVHGISKMETEALASEGDHGITLSLTRFPADSPTPVHDHLTWGVIHVLEGRNRYIAWERLDDASDPERARLRVKHDKFLLAGDSIHWHGPPRDIHSHEAIGAEVWLLAMTGENLRHEHIVQNRHYFDPETGRVTTGTPARP